MREYFLKSKRIGFAIWQADDLALATSLWGQPEVSHYICANHIFTPQEIENRLKHEIELYYNYQIQYFPIFSLETNDLIGCCGLRPFENQLAILEIGFHLKKEYWSQGYAYEAACAMIDYAFNVLKIKELKAGHNPKNVKSKYLLNKLGFEYEFEQFYEPTQLYHPTYRLINPSYDI